MSAGLINCCRRLSLVVRGVRSVFIWSGIRVERKTHHETERVYSRRAQFEEGSEGLTRTAAGYEERESRYVGKLEFRL